MVEPRFRQDGSYCVLIPPTVQVEHAEAGDFTVEDRPPPRLSVVFFRRLRVLRGGLRRSISKFNFENRELIVESFIGDFLERGHPFPQFAFETSGPAMFGYEEHGGHAAFFFFFDPVFELLAAGDEGWNAVARVKILAFPIHLEGNDLLFGAGAMREVRGNDLPLSPMGGCFHEVDVQPPGSPGDAEHGGYHHDMCSDSLIHEQEHEHGRGDGERGDHA